MRLDKNEHFVLKALPLKYNKVSTNRLRHLFEMKRASVAYEFEYPFDITAVLVTPEGVFYGYASSFNEVKEAEEYHHVERIGRMIAFTRAVLAYHNSSHFNHVHLTGCELESFVVEDGYKLLKDRDK